MTVVDRQTRREQLEPGINTFGETPAAPPPLGYVPEEDIPNAQGKVGPQSALQPAPPPPAAPELPPIRTAAEAYRIQQLLKKSQGTLDPETFNRQFTRVRNFNRANPGAIARVKQENANALWLEDNLDTSPAHDSALAKAQRDARTKRARLTTGPNAVPLAEAQKMVPMPERITDLPTPEVGSRAEAIRKHEAAGLDTTSGLTTFGEEFNLARKMSNPSRQFELLTALAYDKLAQAGITLPEGMSAINMNDDLQQLEVLVPTEEGKVRRVLVDPEFMRVQDLGKGADIREAGRVLGATLTQLTPQGRLATGSVARIAQRHPAIAEFVGDLGFGNVGTLVEYWLDSGAELDDLNEAITGSRDGGTWDAIFSPNVAQSGTETAIGRVIGRAMGGNPKKDMVDENYYHDVRRGESEVDHKNRVADRIDQNLEESKQTLEEMNKLTDKQLYYDKGQLADSDAEIAIQKGREERITPEERTDVRVMREANWRAYKDASENIHRRATADNPIDEAVAPHPDAARTLAEAEAKSLEPARNIVPLTQPEHVTLEGNRVLSGNESGIEEHIWVWNSPEATGRISTTRNAAPKLTAAKESLEAYQKQIDDAVTANPDLPGSAQWDDMMRELGRRAEQVNALSVMDGARSGMVFSVDHNTKAIRIEKLGEDSGLPKGSAFFMFEKLLKEYEHLLNNGGYRIESDSTLSQFSVNAAKKMEENGVVLHWDKDLIIQRQTGATRGMPELDTDVEWTMAPDGRPVFTVLEIPGTSYKSVPLTHTAVPYDEALMQQGIEQDMSHLATLEIANIKAGEKLRSLLGFTKDRGRGNVWFNNRSDSWLNRKAKQLMARRDNALMGADLSTDEALLGALFLKSADEDGFQVLEGLTDPELDVANVLRSRQTLLDIYERTGNPEVKEIADYIDHMLSNQQIHGIHGALPADQLAGIRTAYDHSKVVADQYKEKYALIQGSRIFEKQVVDGKTVYTNIELNELGKLMTSSNKFWTHIGPWIRGDVVNGNQVRNALMDLYRQDVLDKGFTSARHTAFLKKYNTALNHVFTPREIEQFTRTNFTSSGRNVMTEAVERYNMTVNRLARYGTLEKGNILGSLDKIGRGEAGGVRTPAPDKRNLEMEKYLNTVRRVNPKAYQEIRQQSITEVQNKLDNLFFGPGAKPGTVDPTKEVAAFKSFIDDNAQALRSLHGDQYVSDLYSLWKGMNMDVRRFRMAPQTEPLQGDVVKTSRTLMGPLNVWQRRVSASNWLRLRFHARKALEMAADPDKLKHLKAARGFPMRSRVAIAAMYRTGQLADNNYGIDMWRSPNDMPEEAYQKGLEWVEWFNGVWESNAVE